MLDEMDRKTRKIMTMNKEFHTKSDIDRLYTPRNKGGRGLLNGKSCIMTEENSLGWNMLDEKDRKNQKDYDHE